MAAFVAPLVMRLFSRCWTRLAALLCGPVLAGCTVSSVPISQGSEDRLKERAVAGDKLGFHVLPGGKQYRLELFRAQLPERPFSVPMDRSLGGLPTNRMSLNRTPPIRVIVDTGAQLSVVEAGLAIAAKADVYAPSDGMLRVAGVGGEERVYLARFHTATIGSWELSDLVTVLRRHTSALRFGGMKVGAFNVNLLGAPVIGAFSYVSFDYPAGKIVFSGKAPFVPSRGAVRIPMEVSESLPYVPLRIGGRTYQAMVDTGARDQIFLNAEVVRELGLQARASDGQKYKAAGLGGMIRGTQFNIPVVHLGEMPLTDVLVDSSTGPWRARIGSVLLERWRTTFDFRGRALWLESPPR
jgi:predicted aspartyl protease